MKVLYVGGNVVDWNAGLNSADLARLAAIRKNSNGVEVFEPIEDLVLEVESSAGPVYLSLYKDGTNKFDKNPENKGIWELRSALEDGKKPTMSLKCLRRPGGGPTNNFHTAATLARSISSSVSLELLVSEQNSFVEGILGNEVLQQNRYDYSYLRKQEKEVNNIHLRCNGRKISYTSTEREFTSGELQGLRERLREKFEFEEGDFLVVNSIKDKNYLNAIIEQYESARQKPTLVTSVTSSMLAKIAKEGSGLNVLGLVEKADIYVSNKEELFEFLKGSSDNVFTHRRSPQQLDDNDLYNGMLQISRNMGKRKRVYVTCGENGAVVMDRDGNLYFQRVSGLVESPTQKQPIVDLNGAGDTFAGVMTLLEAEGNHDVLSILDYSNAAAQICIRREGANAKDMVTRDEIRKFRDYHTQDIWKYDINERKFVRHASVRCNI